MCGLFGYMLTRPVPLLGACLGLANDRRGGHGWGYINLDDEPQVVKGPGKIADFKDPFSDIQKLIGHTRYATTGKVCLENNHPFEIGELIGSHNGMVYNHNLLSVVYDREYEVDSMHLFAHLWEEKDFGEIEGYGVISWYDRRDGLARICQLQNGELTIRKLFKNKEPIGIAWSSRDEDLVKALSYTGLQSYNYCLEEGQVYLLTPEDLYSLNEPKLDLANPYDRFEFEEEDNKDFWVDENNEMRFINYRWHEV